MSGAGWRRPPTAAERAALARHGWPLAGLCTGCRHLRLLRSGRTQFVRCWLAESDPAYPRYPALPVLACNGYEPWDSEPRGGEPGDGEP